jgi:predicted phage-related endonuclease
MTVERSAVTDRASWLARRRGYLCASEIAAAAGVDEFRSALDLHLEKAGLQPPLGDTPLLRRGRHFEPAVLEYLREELPGWRIERPNVFLADPDLRVAATPDAIAEDPEHPQQLVNVQIKVVAEPTFERWNGEPPIGYRLQVSCENMLLGADRGLLAVLVVSSFNAELYLFDQPRHEGAEARIRQIAADFWQRIAEGRLPDPDYSRDREIIEKLFPPDKAVPVPLDLSQDNRIGILCEAYSDAQMRKKNAEADVDALKAEIIDKLRGAELALADGWKITRKMQHRAEHVVQATDFPRLYVSRTKEIAA